MVRQEVTKEGPDPAMEEAERRRKGKAIAEEPPVGPAEPAIPKQIHLGVPTHRSLEEDERLARALAEEEERASQRPSTEGDEALARALAEEEERVVPSTEGERPSNAPAPAAPASRKSKHPPRVPVPAMKKQKTEHLPAEWPRGIRQKSDLTIPELCELMGKKLERLAFPQPSLPSNPNANVEAEVESLKRDVHNLAAAFTRFEENMLRREEDIKSGVIAEMKEQFRRHVAEPRTNPLDPTDLEKIVVAVQGTIRESEDKQAERMGRIAMSFERKLKADAEERKNQKELLQAFANYIQSTTGTMTTKMDDMERQLKYVTEEKVMMRHTLDSHVSIIADLIIEAQKWMPNADNAKVMALLKQRPPSREEIEQQEKDREDRRRDREARWKAEEEQQRKDGRS